MTLNSSYRSQAQRRDDAINYDQRSAVQVHENISDIISKFREDFKVDAPQQRDGRITTTKTLMLEGNLNPGDPHIIVASSLNFGKSMNITPLSLYPKTDKLFIPFGSLEINREALNFLPLPQDIILNEYQTHITSAVSFAIRLADVLSRGKVIKNFEDRHHMQTYAAISYLNLLPSMFSSRAKL